MSILDQLGSLSRSAVGLLPYGSAIQEYIFDPGVKAIDWAAEKVTSHTKGLDPDVKQGLNLLVESWNEYYAEETGARAALFEGFRSAKRQHELFLEGRSQKDAGTGKHEKGLAGDVWFKDEAGWINPDDVPPDWYYALGELGEEIGFTWGGRWKTLVDMPHFEV